MPTTRTTRRTKGAVLAPVYDDPMPRKSRSRATSVASSQRSNERSHDPAPALNAISRLTSHNEELPAENNGLREELEILEKQKVKRWTLRDKQLAMQLAEHRDPSADPEPAPKQTPSTTATRQTVAATPPTPPSRSILPPDSSGTITAATLISTPTSVPRWRQFLSSFTGFTPFSARKPREPATEPPREQQRASSPLGQLPQNRKRSAPVTQPEDEDTDTPTKRSKTPEREQHSHSTREAPASASKPQLATISEQSEPNQQKRIAANPPATPTRSTRRKAAATAPHTEKITRTEMQSQTGTPKRRTIRDTRQSRDTRSTTQPQSARLLKRWEAPQKPREPNADKRLARMQQLERLKAEKTEMEKEIARLAAEQEADGIDTRKRKRVKVDELAFIPHNQPGDAAGTFRVPEWDSDDEMEVDEAIPVKKNVFMANAEQTQQNQQSQQKQLNKENLQPASLTSPAKPRQPVQQQPAQIPAATLPPASLFKPAAPAPAPAQQPPVSTGPAVSKPLFQSSPAKPSQNIAQPQPSPVLPAAAAAAAAAASKPKSKVTWPSVGSKTTHDTWSAQQKIAGGQKFSRGFDSWLAVS